MSTPNHIETMNQLKAQYPWLNTLIELILTAVRKMLTCVVLSFLDMTDERNDCFSQIREKNRHINHLDDD